MEELDQRDSDFRGVVWYYYPPVIVDQDVLGQRYIRDLLAKYMLKILTTNAR